MASGQTRKLTSCRGPIAQYSRRRYSPWMNDDKDALTIAITGNLTVARDEFEQLMRRLLVASPAPGTEAQTRSIKPPEASGKAPRLAYTVKETAELLGISQATVYRLMYRGLLKPSLALRTKLIAKSEIERFLKDTSSGF